MHIAATLPISTPVHLEKRVASKRRRLPASAHCITSTSRSTLNAQPLPLCEASPALRPRRLSVIRVMYDFTIRIMFLIERYNFHYSFCSFSCVRLSRLWPPRSLRGLLLPAEAVTARHFNVSAELRAVNKLRLFYAKLFPFACDMNHFKNSYFYLFLVRRRRPLALRKMNFLRSRSDPSDSGERHFSFAEKFDSTAAATTTRIRSSRA